MYFVYEYVWVVFVGLVGDDGKLELVVVIIQFQVGEGVGLGGSINVQGVGGVVLIVCGYCYQ